MFLQDGTARINLTAGDYRIEFQNIHLRVISGPDAGLKGSFCLPVVRIGTAADNDFILTVAPTTATVLITGESGSGKELVARTLHELSGRKGLLVIFDASVTDPEMIRNDLFGHVKGAFTGASGTREGAFRRAHLGTLFIDEIGELPLDLQPRLLRALENREVTPIGSDQPVRVDVRVIAATHRDLGAMVRAGTFRADLFYRLSILPIRA